jgi:hypothetical protein
MYARLSITFGSHGSVVGWGTMLQARRSRIRDPMRSMKFFYLPNPSSHTRPWSVLSLLTEISKWVEHSRIITLTTSPLSVSWLSRQCGIVNISQPYMPARPVTGISFFIDNFYASLLVAVNMETAWWSHSIESLFLNCKLKHNTSVGFEVLMKVAVQSTGLRISALRNSERNIHFRGKHPILRIKA